MQYHVVLDRVITALDCICQLVEAEYMHQYTGPALVQIMACCLFGARPLSESMMAYFLGSKFKWNTNQNKTFSFTRKYIWLCKMKDIMSQPQCAKTGTIMGSDIRGHSNTIILSYWYKNILLEKQSSPLSAYLFWCRLYQWLGTRLRWLQCISYGVTAVLW